jgi:hypothetical protein
VSPVGVLQKLVEFPTYVPDGMHVCADFISKEDLEDAVSDHDTHPASHGFSITDLIECPFVGSPVSRGPHTNT